MRRGELPTAMAMPRSVHSSLLDLCTRNLLADIYGRRLVRDCRMSQGRIFTLSFDVMGPRPETQSKSLRSLVIATLAGQLAASMPSLQSSQRQRNDRHHRQLVVGMFQGTPLRRGFFLWINVRFWPKAAVENRSIQVT